MPKTTQTLAAKRKAATRVPRRRKPQRRRPAMGLLEPGGSIVLVIDPPLQPHEQPVAMTPNAGDILLRDATLDRVTIVNQTDRVVAYMMTVVPRLLVKAATVPWKRVVTDLGTALQKSGMLDRFARLLK